MLPTAPRQTDQFVAWFSIVGKSGKGFLIVVDVLGVALPPFSIHLRPELKIPARPILFGKVSVQFLGNFLGERDKFGVFDRNGKTVVGGCVKVLLARSTRHHSSFL